VESPSAKWSLRNSAGQSLADILDKISPHLRDSPVAFWRESSLGQEGVGLIDFLKKFFHRDEVPIRLEMMNYAVQVSFMNNEALKREAEPYLQSEMISGLPRTLQGFLDELSTRSESVLGLCFLHYLRSIAFYLSGELREDRHNKMLHWQVLMHEMLYRWAQQGESTEPPAAPATVRLREPNGFVSRYSILFITTILSIVALALLILPSLRGYLGFHSLIPDKRIELVQNVSDADQLPTELRDMIHASSVQSLAATKRHSDDYLEHVENSKRYILEGAQGLKGTALLLGLGNAMEYGMEGLAALAEQFDHLIAVDLDVETMRSTLERLDEYRLSQGKGPLSQKFELKGDDLSHALVKFAKRTDDIVHVADSVAATKEPFHTLMGEIRKDIETVPGPNYQVQYTVSSLVMSQLAALMQEYYVHAMEMKFGPGNAPLDESWNALREVTQFRHVKDINSWTAPGGRIYFADTISETETVRDSRGRVVPADAPIPMVIYELQLNMSERSQSSHVWQWSRKPDKGTGQRGWEYSVWQFLLERKPATAQGNIVPSIVAMAGSLATWSLAQHFLASGAGSNTEAFIGALPSMPLWAAAMVFTLVLLWAFHQNGFRLQSVIQSLNPFVDLANQERDSSVPKTRSKGSTFKTAIVAGLTIVGLLFFGLPFDVMAMTFESVTTPVRTVQVQTPVRPTRHSIPFTESRGNYFHSGELDPRTRLAIVDFRNREPLQKGGQLVIQFSGPYNYLRGKRLPIVIVAASILDSEAGSAIVRDDGTLMPTLSSNLTGVSLSIKIQDPALITSDTNKIRISGITYIPRSGQAAVQPLIRIDHAHLTLEAA